MIIALLKIEGKRRREWLYTLLHFYL